VEEAALRCREEEEARQAAARRDELAQLRAAQAALHVAGGEREELAAQVEALSRQLLDAKAEALEAQEHAAALQAQSDTVRAAAQVQAQALRAEVASWREEAGLADH